ncbi:uncharacterized protein LOC125943696 [Dermacentor silvarum]|uniref:uncharacterized protein LOC125943696 n=1 Tax=Dermacentor silvarum TaxID=543639 RepID=UPI002100D25A|nr:uncharacterized protein LOC125943696 [Dermacentor silvarum]
MEPAPSLQAPVTTLLPHPRSLDTTGDVWQSWRTWRQEFDLYATATYLSQQPKERLMGRLTRTLLPVPATHLQPRTVQPKDVQQRLLDIRRKQRTYYNRGTKPLPELPLGARVTVYNVPSGTWSPATIIQRGDSPRSYIFKGEDGRQFQRTREHLGPSYTPSGQDAVAPVPQVAGTPESPTQQPVRRSHRTCRPPTKIP